MTTITNELVQHIRQNIGSLQYVHGATVQEVQAAWGKVPVTTISIDHGASDSNAVALVGGYGGIKLDGLDPLAGGNQPFLLTATMALALIVKDEAAYNAALASLSPTRRQTAAEHTDLGQHVPSTWCPMTQLTGNLTTSTRSRTCMAAKAIGRWLPMGHMTKITSPPLHNLTTVCEK